MKTPVETESLAVMQQCPRFARCSVPICPLDVLQDLRDRLPGEPRCTLPKSRRYRIGKDTELELHGLTRREWAGRMQWEALSEAEKRCRTAKLRGLS